MSEYSFITICHSQKFGCTKSILSFLFSRHFLRRIILSIHNTLNLSISIFISDTGFYLAAAGKGKRWYCTLRMSTSIFKFTVNMIWKRGYYISDIEQYVDWWTVILLSNQKVVWLSMSQSCWCELLVLVLIVMTRNRWSYYNVVAGFVADYMMLKDIISVLWRLIL